MKLIAYTTGINLFKVNSKQWKRQSNVWNLMKINYKDIGVSIANFAQTSRIVLVFSLLILNK